MHGVSVVFRSLALAICSLDYGDCDSACLLGPWGEVGRYLCMFFRLFRSRVGCTKELRGSFCDGRFHWRGEETEDVAWPSEGFARVKVEGRRPPKYSPVKCTGHDICTMNEKWGILDRNEEWERERLAEGHNQFETRGNAKEDARGEVFFQAD